MSMFDDFEHLPEHYEDEKKEQLDKLTKLERWNNKLLKLGIHDITERRVRLIEFMTLDED